MNRSFCVFELAQVERGSKIISQGNFLLVGMLVITRQEGIRGKRNIHEALET